MSHLRYLCLFACCVMAASTIATTARADEIGDSKPDDRAIRGAATKYSEAKRAGDVEALLEMWTSDGDYIDAAGQVFNAHELIRASANQPTPESASAEASEQESSLRFVTPDVAIEDGTSRPVVSSDGSVIAGRFTAVWVKRDGRWLLDSLREAAANAPSAHDQLLPLEWLIGEWVGATEDSTMLVSSRWSEAGNYIVRDFMVRSDGREALSGTQRIGWDPIANKIKSWTFDSHGGASEGYWRREGDRWVVDSEEVMPDGKTSTASVVHTPDGDGRFVWEVSGAKVDNQTLPSIRVEFERAEENE